MAGEQVRLPLAEAVVSWRGVSYLNLERRGEGGSAVVYRTIATTGQRRGVTFAVKLFRAATREGWSLNFMREVHVLRDCDHPAIMKIHDEGMYLDRYPFVVMEYLPTTLKDRLKARDRTMRENVSIMLHLLSALNYLSRREPPVVHRDIKPQNIFMKEDACVLGDFGLILQIGERAEAATPGGARVAEMAQKYRTPELVSYHKGGPEPPAVSDVFQLGLVASELFTGVNPLRHAGPSRPIVLDEVPSIEGLIGESIRRVINQMLIVETGDRPDASYVLGDFLELYRRMPQHERKRGAGDSDLAAVGPSSTGERPAGEPRETQTIPPPSVPAPNEFGEGILDDEGGPAMAR